MTIMTSQKNKKLDPASKLKAICIGIAAGMLNGIFGAGGGTLVVPALTFFFKEPQVKAQSTAIAIMLGLSLVSAIIYMQGDVLDTRITFLTGIGSVAGGLLGAYVLVKIKPKWLSKIFGVVMILSAIRLFFK